HRISVGKNGLTYEEIKRICWGMEMSVNLVYKGECITTDAKYPKNMVFLEFTEDESTKLGHYNLILNYQAYVGKKGCHFCLYCFKWHYVEEGRCTQEGKNKPFSTCCKKCLTVLKNQKHKCIDIAKEAKKLNEDEQKKIFIPKRWGESAPLIRKPKVPQPSENFIFYDYETVLNENNRHK